MSQEQTSTRRAATARLALALAAAAIGLSSLLAAHRQLDSRERHLALLVESGLSERRPEIVDSLGRETDPARAGLLIARALLGDALERLHEARPPLDEETIADVVRQLAAARRLAEEGRRRRPAAWQAHMIVGATTYLEWTLRHDRRVATEATAWETPLRTAIELAPAQAEPRRFLTMAYLELWSMLSDEKRGLARELVAIAFESPQMLARLLPAWLEATSTLEEALAPIPDDSRAWRVVEQHFAREKEWEAFVVARRSALDALRRECEASLARAAALRGRSAAQRARALVEPVLAALPVEASWSELLARSLERLPAGLVGRQVSDRLRAWLEWNLEGCALERCRLPPRTASRLAGLAGELPLTLRARAALAAEDLASAEAFERRADRVKSEAWAAYLIEKVPHLLRREEIREAAAALDAVHPSHRSSLPFLHAARALAVASEDAEGLAAVRFALDRRTGGRFTAEEWSLLGEGSPHRRFCLDVELAARAKELVLLVEQSPSAGAVSEIRIDGAAIAVEVVREDSRRLRIASAVEPGPHRLELRPVAGGTVVPGPGRLLDAPR